VAPNVLIRGMFESYKKSTDSRKLCRFVEHISCHRQKIPALIYSEKNVFFLNYRVLLPVSQERCGISEFRSHYFVWLDWDLYCISGRKNLGFPLKIFR